MSLSCLALTWYLCQTCDDYSGLHLASDTATGPVTCDWLEVGSPRGGSDLTELVTNMHFMSSLYILRMIVMFRECVPLMFVCLVLCESKSIENTIFIEWISGCPPQLELLPMRVRLGTATRCGACVCVCVCVVVYVCGCQR